MVFGLFYSFYRFSGCFDQLRSFGWIFLGTFCGIEGILMIGEYIGHFCDFKGMFLSKKNFYFTHENYQNIKYPKNTQNNSKMTPLEPPK